MSGTQKKSNAVSVELPECPVCFETMCAPIFQCQSGHSLCNTCTSTLSPSICPICRQIMTQMRNWTLEEIVSKAKIPCPNKKDGCIFTVPATDISDHLKECWFREVDCPVGVIFGKCNWKGKTKTLMEHFEARHPENCNLNTDTDVVLTNVNINQDDRFFYLLAQAKLLFTMTVKIDITQNTVFWAIQHIGGKRVAHSHIYEIHITSLLEPRRKVVFTEHCFNDAMKADDVFRTGKCGALPLDCLKNFMMNKKMVFRFFIKRLPSPPKNDTANHSPNNANENKLTKSKGPGKGPRSASSGPKGRDGNTRKRDGPGHSNAPFKHNHGARNKI